jgi:hypothetical protein
MYSDDEFGHGGCNISYAVIEITHALRARVRQVLERLGDIAKETRFLRVVFLTYDIDVYENIPEELAEKLADNGMIELPEDMDIATLGDSLRLDYGLLQIEDDCLRWGAREKHCSIEAESCNFYYEMLGWTELVAKKKP